MKDCFFSLLSFNVGKGRILYVPYIGYCIERIRIEWGPTESAREDCFS